MNNKEILAFYTKNNINKNSQIEILYDTFVVKDGNLIENNEESCLIIKNVKVKDGIYDKTFFLATGGFQLSAIYNMKDYFAFSYKNDNEYKKININIKTINNCKNFLDCGLEPKEELKGLYVTNNYICTTNKIGAYIKNIKNNLDANIIIHNEMLNFINVNKLDYFKIYTNYDFTRIQNDEIVYFKKNIKGIFPDITPIVKDFNNYNTSSVKYNSKLNNSNLRVIKSEMKKLELKNIVKISKDKLTYEYQGNDIEKLINFNCGKLVLKLNLDMLLKLPDKVYNLIYIKDDDGYKTNKIMFEEIPIGIFEDVTEKIIISLN